jgi:hypothetical protein
VERSGTSTGPRSSSERFRTPAWRDLQELLEERDREWWAGADEFEDDA